VTYAGSYLVAETRNKIAALARLDDNTSGKRF
jgi:hypothetical protein